MADRLDIETLVNKTGGPFYLTVLIQKRLKELKEGAEKLVDLETDDLLEIVYQEIIEDKIELIPEADGQERDGGKVEEIFKR